MLQCLTGNLAMFENMQFGAIAGNMRKCVACGIDVRIGDNAQLWRHLIRPATKANDALNQPGG